MNRSEIVVRIVKPASKPAVPRVKSAKLKQKGNNFFKKMLNISLGSGLGILAGVIIYLMLILFGLNFDGLESSLIIGLPSVLGIITSFVIF